MCRGGLAAGNHRSQRQESGGREPEPRSSAGASSVERDPSPPSRSSPCNQGHASPPVLAANEQTAHCWCWVGGSLPQLARKNVGAGSHAVEGPVTAHSITASPPRPPSASPDSQANPGHPPPPCPATHVRFPPALSLAPPPDGFCLSFSLSSTSPSCRCTPERHFACIPSLPSRPSLPTRGSGHRPSPHSILSFSASLPRATTPAPQRTRALFNRGTARQ